MVTITALWLPILLSTVLIFVVSSVIHTVLGYHKSDFEKIPSEEQVSEALQPFKIPPGDYVMPRAESTADMKSEAYKAKLEKGPVAFLTVMPNGQFSMGSSLIQWFVYCLVIGIFCAYLTGRSFGPGADYLEVFRYSGTTAFLAYSMALFQDSIWFKRKWSTTLKFAFDGLIYALLTAGMFGWLWP